MELRVEDRLRRWKLALFERGLVQGTLGRLWPAPRDKRWIFIVGCYNSGTTLLDHLLGGHPEIGSLPSEGAALTRSLTRPEDFGWPRMWHLCQERMVGVGEGPDAQRVKRDWGLLYDRNRELCLEKSVANSARIPWLHRNFAEPHFLWIIRNGYAVAEGIRRRVAESSRRPALYPDGYPLELCVRQWIVNNEVIERDTRGLPNVLRITYEDLTNRTEQTLGRVLDWLPVELKYFESADSFRFHGADRPIRDMNAESFGRLRPEEVAKISQLAGEHLQRWGYSRLSS